MRERLWQPLKSVRRAERGRFLFFAVLSSMLSLAQTLGLAGSEALLIGRRGAGALPVAFVVAALASVAFSLLYATVVGRARNDRLFAAMFAAGGLMLLAGAVGAAAAWPLVPTLLFCAFFIGQALFFNHFWTFAGDHFDTLASKRMFPLFTAAGSVGGALGGGLAAGISRVAPPEALIAGWALGLGGCALLLQLNRSRLLRWGPMGFEEHDETSVAGLRAALLYSRQSALGRWLVLSATSMVLTLFVSQYLYSSVFAARFPSAEELAAFFGLFLLLSNLAEIVLELAVTPWLIRRFGLASANLVHPVFTIAAFVALSAHFQLPAALLARSSRELLDNAVAAPVRNLVYNALPLRLRGRMRALLEGIVVYSGMALAGALLVSLQRPDPRFLCALGGVLGLAYLAANLGVRRAYLRALVDQMREGRLDLRDLGEGLGGAEIQRLGGLWAELVEGDADEPALAALELAPLLARRGLGEPLLGAAAHRDPRVRAAVVEALGDVAGEEPWQAVIRALRDPDPSVRRAAVRALGSRAEEDADVAEALRQCLADEDAGVRAKAAAALGEEGRETLRTLAASERPEAAEAGLASLPEALGSCAVQRLHAADPGIRAAALEAVVRLEQAEDLEPELLDRLAEDPSARVRGAAVGALAAQPASWAIGALARALGDAVREVRQAAADALAAAGEAGLRAAAERLGDENPNAASAALRAVSRTGGERAMRLLREAYRELVLRTWDHLLALHALGTAGEPTLRYLQLAHGDGLRRDRARAFETLSALEGVDLVESVQRALRVGAPAERTEALEVLSNLGEREAARLLTLLHEEERLEDRIREEPSFESRPRGPEDVVAAAQRSGERWIRLAAQAGSESGTEESQTMETLIALRRIPIFSTLQLDQLESISGLMREESYVAGEVVIREGDSGSDLYLLLDGEVAIYRDYGSEEQHELNRLRPVASFGEMAVLDNERRTATVVVTRDARLLSLAGQRLKELILQMPELSFDIFRELIRRVRAAEAGGAPGRLSDRPT